MAAYLVLQAGIGLLLAAALAAGGILVERRRREERQDAATRWFVLWWLGLAAAWATWSLDALLANASRGAGGAAAYADYALILLYFALILLSFGSLCAYLLYLYTGRRGVMPLAAAAYGILTLVVLGLFVLVNHPSTFVVTSITDALFGQYQSLADGLRIALLAPVVLLALALYLVYPRMREPVKRRRVLLVSTSLFLYLLMPLLFPSNPGVAPADGGSWAREIANKAGLGLALAALLVAYRPSARVEASARRGPEAESAFQRRVHQLV